MSTSVCEKDSRVSWKYGNQKTADVILEAGDWDFHVQKGLLSAHSEFFARLFNSDFKEKNQDRIKMSVDQKAFKNLMEIIYNRRVTTEFGCPRGGTHICGLKGKLCGRDWAQQPIVGPVDCRQPNKVYDKEWAEAMWSETMGTLQLADMYGIDFVKETIKDKMSSAGCNGEGCTNCALKIFLHFAAKMDNAMSFSKEAIFRSINWYFPIIPDFTVNGLDVKQLLDMIPE